MRQRGFSYLGLLFAVALLGVLLAGTGQVWHTTAQREKEAELLFVGKQYREAIASYFERTPAAAGQYPARLEDLLEDRRFPMPVRHLRRLYADPMTGSPDWELVIVGGNIVGVHSRSDRKPIRTAFDEPDAAFATAETYAEWIFVAAPGAPVPPAAASKGTTGK